MRYLGTTYYNRNITGLENTTIIIDRVYKMSQNSNKALKPIGRSEYLKLANQCVAKYIKQWSQQECPPKHRISIG